MRTQRHRFSRTLLENLEARTLLSTTLTGDPADTDPSSVPVPPIQVPQTPAHSMTLSGTPAIISQTDHDLDISLGTMSDTLSGTTPDNYRVWAMLTNGDASFSPFATGEAAANGAGGFDMTVHFHFDAAMPTGVVTVHFGVYWAGLLGQSEWPAELALGEHADVMLADQSPTTPTTPTAPNDPAIPALPAAPTTHRRPAGLVGDAKQLFGADFVAWDAGRGGTDVSSLHDFLAANPGTHDAGLSTITIDTDNDAASVKKTVIKHVTMATMH